MKPILALYLGCTLSAMVGCATARPQPAPVPVASAPWGAKAWVRFLMEPLPVEGSDTPAPADTHVDTPYLLVEERTQAQLAQARASEVSRAWDTLSSLTSDSLPSGTRLRFLWWMRAVHTHGSARAEAWVEEAGLVQPERPPLLDEDFAAAWYSMHEEILRRWPEEVKDGSQWVLQRGAEEFAIWYIGGIIGKGTGALLEFVPKVMQTVLARGGQEAAAWLRTALVRLSPAEKESFKRLWAKLLVEGEEALSLSERQALRQTMLLFQGGGREDGPSRQ